MKIKGVRINKNKRQDGNKVGIVPMPDPAILPYFFIEGGKKGGEKWKGMNF